jgi:hypothetical protein
VYTLESLTVGALELRDVEVAVIDATPEMRRAMGLTTPAILGTKVVEAGAWTFALATSRWGARDTTNEHLIDPPGLEPRR